MKTYVFNLYIMAINIGEKIKARAKQMRIGPTELGKMINTSKQNIYGIYKRKAVDTEILRKLSAALEYDFFELYRLSDEGTKNSAISGKQEKGIQKSVSFKEYQKLKADFENLKEARKRQAEIKRWVRSKKMELINKKENI
jgi:hypothetical protein